MNHAFVSDRVMETLEHLEGHWEEKRKAAERAEQLSAKPTHFTIAIAREAGTPAGIIGHQLAARLGWPVYDHELLQRIAQDMAVHARLLESVDERRVGWLKEVFESVLDVPFVSEFAFVHRLVKAVLALGAHGECIIVGRGSAFILPPESTLRVRLVAPLMDRALTASKNHGASLEDAKRKLSALDKERNAFVRDHFMKDPSDPCQYDLILNTSRLGAAECVELIVKALHAVQMKCARPEIARAG